MNYPTNGPPMGSMWRDNDPRCQYRVVEVVGYDSHTGKVRIKFAGRMTRTSIFRFGKRGRVGFTRHDADSTQVYIPSAVDST
jgi:hypothetical protein